MILSWHTGAHQDLFDLNNFNYTYTIENTRERWSILQTDRRQIGPGLDCDEPLWLTVKTNQNDIKFIIFFRSYKIKLPSFSSLHIFASICVPLQSNLVESWHVPSSQQLFWNGGNKWLICFTNKRSVENEGFKRFTKNMFVDLILFLYNPFHHERQLFFILRVRYPVT